MPPQTWVFGVHEFVVSWLSRCSFMLVGSDTSMLLSTLEPFLMWFELVRMHDSFTQKVEVDAKIEVYQLLRQARGFIWCRLNGALALYSSLPRPFLPSGGARNRDKGIAHLALQAWENSAVLEMRTIKRPSDRLWYLHELRARLPVRLGSANTKLKKSRRKK